MRRGEVRRVAQLGALGGAGADLQVGKVADQIIAALGGGHLRDALAKFLASERQLVFGDFDAIDPSDDLVLLRACRKGDRKGEKAGAQGNRGQSDAQPA